jgi:hypothetical protein
MVLNERADVLEYRCPCSQSIVLTKDDTVHSSSVFQLREMLAATFERLVSVSVYVFLFLFNL